MFCILEKRDYLFRGSAHGGWNDRIRAHVRAVKVRTVEQNNNQTLPLLQVKFSWKKKNTLTTRYTDKKKILDQNTMLENNMVL
jgi:hypothetical protein